MGNPEFGEANKSEEVESPEVHRQRIAAAFKELKLVVEGLVSSGSAQDGHAHTPELKHAEDLGEQLRGEPIRGYFNGRHYYLGMPSSSLSVPQELPGGFDDPLALGTLEGVVKKQKLQENPELVIGVSPFVLSEREDIKAHFKPNYHANYRWHQPLGQRNKNLNKQLWLPAVDFIFVLGHPDDDYMAAKDTNAGESSQDA
jgi:hypothetical protein